MGLPSTDGGWSAETLAYGYEAPFMFGEEVVDLLRFEIEPLRQLFRGLPHSAAGEDLTEGAVIDEIAAHNPNSLTFPTVSNCGPPFGQVGSFSNGFHTLLW